MKRSNGMWQLFANGIHELMHDLFTMPSSVARMVGSARGRSGRFDA